MVIDMLKGVPLLYQQGTRMKNMLSTQYGFIMLSCNNAVLRRLTYSLLLQSLAPKYGTYISKKNIHPMSIYSTVVHSYNKAGMVIHNSLL